MSLPMTAAAPRANAGTAYPRRDNNLLRLAPVLLKGCRPSHHRKYLMPAFRTIAAAVAIAASFGAQAFTVTMPDITTYSTRADYLAATGNNTTIDFEAQNPSPWYTYYGSSLTVGDVAFSGDGALFVFNHSTYGASIDGSSYFNNNFGGTQLGIAFANSVHGFALDLGSLYNWGRGAFQITLDFAGASQTIDLLGNDLYDGGRPVFAGFTSSVAFDSITITDPTRGLAIDNFSFTAQPAAAAVPEPASLALAGIALAGLAVTRRRRG